VREHREGDVPVPARVLPNLVVVQARLAFRSLEGFLYRPTSPAMVTNSVKVVRAGQWHR